MGEVSVLYEFYVMLRWLVLVYHRFNGLNIRVQLPRTHKSSLRRNPSIGKEAARHHDSRPQTTTCGSCEWTRPEKSCRFWASDQNHGSQWQGVDQVTDRGLVDAELTCNSTGSLANREWSGKFTPSLLKWEENCFK